MKFLSPLLVLLCLMTLHGSAHQKNIIFIISDDHRYDAMGFMGKIPWLETPGLDRMAREGMHVKNAFVTTALCSPSRASVLTGLYAHTQIVVDNSAPEPQDILYFPQLLQEAGYQTAFFGKWHTGNQGDHPRKAFNHWEGLRGQGELYDLENDPYEMQDLITEPQHKELSKDLSAQVLDWLQNTNGMQIPLKRNVYPKIDHKYRGQY
jgi:N-acetylglucosamine-6-sulfatase